MNNNQRLKLIHSALLITDKDLARAATLGGIPTSRNRAKSWLRGTLSKRDHGGQTQRRFVEITQDKFDAVLMGLRPMLDEQEE